MMEKVKRHEMSHKASSSGPGEKLSSTLQMALVSSIGMRQPVGSAFGITSRCIFLLGC